MDLNPLPFEAIINGNKSIEVRLNDAKRKKIEVGDTIIFTKLPSNIEKISVKVIDLYPCKTFLELYRKLDSNDFRTKTEDAFIKNIYSIYTKTQEQKYGVLGIRIKLVL